MEIQGLRKPRPKGSDDDAKHVHRIQVDDYYGSR